MVSYICLDMFGYLEDRKEVDGIFKINRERVVLNILDILVFYVFKLVVFFNLILILKRI